MQTKTFYYHFVTSSYVLVGFVFCKEHQTCVLLFAEMNLQQ